MKKFTIDTLCFIVLFSALSSCSSPAGSNPSVLSIEITPSTMFAGKGRIMQLSAVVNVTGGASQDVEWNLDNEGGTGIGKVTLDPTGILEIAGDANVGTAIIRATSLYDSTKYATCTVEIIDPGNGTLGNPFKIYDTETLQHVGKPATGIYSNYTLSAYYEQIQDIDMTTIQNFTPIGDYNNDTRFKGRYDGNNHIIKDLTITSTNVSVGLFGSIDGISPNIGEIKNLGLIDCRIEGNEFSNTGGIVGVSYTGKVLNCFVTGNISGKYITGGLVGFDTDGTIENSFFSGRISGLGDIGGIAGRLGNGFCTIQNCYVIGIIEYDHTLSGSYIGGLVGINNGKIQNCFTMCIVLNQGSSGGLVSNNYTGTVKNCVALNQSITGSGTNIGRIAGIENSYSTLSNNHALASMTLDGSVLSPGTGTAGNKHGADIPTDAQKDQGWWKDARANWTPWDFSTIWVWDDNAKRPKLWYEH